MNATPKETPPIEPERFIARLAELATSYASHDAPPLPAWVSTACARITAHLLPVNVVRQYSRPSDALITGAVVGFIKSGGGRLLGLTAAQITSVMPEMKFPEAPYGYDNAEAFWTALIDGSVFDRTELREAVAAFALANDAATRTEFAAGLIYGGSFPELLQNVAAGTDPVVTLYFRLVLYWPEIASCRSLPEAYRFVCGLYGAQLNLLGDFDTFRKRANRIGLSFRRSRSAA